jgi:hypothetical protein
MALQGSGAISLNEIAAEFGGTAPHSMSEYLRGGNNVPTTLTGTSTESAPSVDGTQNNFGITGLTVKKFTRQTPTYDNSSDIAQATLAENKYYNVKFNYSRTHQLSGTPNSSNEVCVRGTLDPIPRLNITSDRADTNVSVTSGETGGGSSNPTTNRVVDFFVDNVNVGNFAPSGQTLPSTQIAQYHKHATGAQNDGGTYYPDNCSSFTKTLTNGVTITLQGYVTANTTLTLAKAGSTGTANAISASNQGDTFYYLWTNGTGGTISVESTSLTSTDQIISPDGSNNFSVSYTDAIANTDIPTSGKVSMTDFYGGRNT